MMSTYFYWDLPDVTNTWSIFTIKTYIYKRAIKIDKELDYKMYLSVKVTMNCI